MKTELNLDGKYLILCPETDIEEQLIVQAFSSTFKEDDIKCYVKTGLTLPR